MTDPSPSFKKAMLAALPSLRAFAMSLSGRPDRADDLVQETVMRAWAKQESFQPGTNMNAWLFTILRNLFYSQMRRRGREVQDTDGAFTASVGVPVGQAGAKRRAAGRIAQGAEGSRHCSAPPYKRSASAFADVAVRPRPR